MTTATMIKGTHNMGRSACCVCHTRFADADKRAPHEHRVYLDDGVTILQGVAHPSCKSDSERVVAVHENQA